MNVENVAPFLQVTPSMTSGSLHRSAEELLTVLRQFNVQANNRYRWEFGKTYCNIFVSDATAALGAPIPHVVEAGPGNKPDALNANETVQWLERLGPMNGWRPCGRKEASELAGCGMVVVACLKASPTGHVAMVLPPDPAHPGRIMIAQAGAKNFFNEPIEFGFGSTLENVTFWVHH